MAHVLRPLLTPLAAALVFLPCARAYAVEPDEPIRPRFETPSEIAAKKTLPRFEKPSEGGGESVPTAAKVDVPAGPNLPAFPVGDAPVGPAFDETPARLPSFYSFPRGYWRDWSADQNLVVPSKVTGHHGVFYARGSYSYLSGGFHDWSSVELVAQADLADGLSAAVDFHHEYRDERGEFGLATLAGLITPSLLLLTKVGLGNGSYFLPLTEVDVELNGVLSRKFSSNYGVGAGTSSWSQDRRQTYGSLRYLYYFPADFSGEARFALYALSSSRADTRLNYLTTLTFVHGKPGETQLQLRASVGDAPQYAPNADLSLLANEPILDVSLSLRQWITPNYGHIFNLEGGGQRDRYRRIGLEYGIFMKLW